MSDQKEISKESRWLLEEKYQGISSAEYQNDLSLLQEGYPLAYLIGWVNFLGNHIDLSAHPLIPRTETEWWCEQAIHEIDNQTLPKKFLDLFAGSGCIGVALLAHFPLSQVDFADIDPKFLSGIEQSCAHNAILSTRYKLIESDIFSHIKGKYDIIFANPPYISQGNAFVETNVLRHEPHHALFSKNNGHFHIQRALEDSADHLTLGGLLYLEYSPEQKEWIEECATQHGYKAEMRKDQYGTYRWARLEKTKPVDTPDIA